MSYSHNVGLQCASAGDEALSPHRTLKFQLLIKLIYFIEHFKLHFFHRVKGLLSST